MSRRSCSNRRVGRRHIQDGRRLQSFRSLHNNFVKLLSVNGIWPPERQQDKRVLGPCRGALGKHAQVARHRETVDGYQLVPDSDAPARVCW